MSKRFPGLTEDHAAFIAAQPVFFVATAPRDGRVNVSPKGMDSLRVLGPGRIVWLNVTGSGNETAAHLREDPRMTLMWCGFGARAMILRAYGTARVTHRGEAGWGALAALLPEVPGARQVVDVAVDLVQTSCGFAVPFMEFAGERPVLRDWAVQKGDALPAYWAEKNARTIDGRPTGIEAAR